MAAKKKKAGNTAKKASPAQLAARAAFAARAKAKSKSTGSAKAATNKKSKSRSNKRDERSDKGERRVPSLATPAIGKRIGGADPIVGVTDVTRPKAIKPKTIQMGVGPRGPIFIDYYV